MEDTHAPHVIPSILTVREAIIALASTKILLFEKKEKVETRERRRIKKKKGGLIRVPFLTCIYKIYFCLFFLFK